MINNKVNDIEQFSFLNVIMFHEKDFMLQENG